jgi:hypothetical protein
MSPFLPFSDLNVFINEISAITAPMQDIFERVQILVAAGSV